MYRISHSHPLELQLFNISILSCLHILGVGRSVISSAGEAQLRSESVLQAGNELFLFLESARFDA